MWNQNWLCQCLRNYGRIWRWKYSRGVNFRRIGLEPKNFMSSNKNHLPPDLYSLCRNLALIVNLSKIRYRDVRPIVYRSASESEYITRQFSYRCIIILRNLNSVYIYAVHIKDWLCSFSSRASCYFPLFEQFMEWTIGSI